MPERGSWHMAPTQSPVGPQRKATCTGSQPRAPPHSQYPQSQDVPASCHATRTMMPWQFFSLISACRSARTAFSSSDTILDRGREEKGRPHTTRSGTGDERDVAGWEGRTACRVGAGGAAQRRGVGGSKEPPACLPRPPLMRPAAVVFLQRPLCAVMATMAPLNFNSNGVHQLLMELIPKSQHPWKVQSNSSDNFLHLYGKFFCVMSCGDQLSCQLRGLGGDACLAGLPPTLTPVSCTYASVVCGLAARLARPAHGGALCDSRRPALAAPPPCKGLS